MTDLGPLVDATIHAADALNEAMLPGLDGYSTAELASLLTRLRHARTTLQALENSYETAIGRTEYGDVEVEGVGLLNVRRSRSRKQWNHDGLAAAIIDKRMEADHPDGDPPPPWDVRDWIMEAAGVAYWRTTPLKALGIDPDDYCTIERGRVTVQITPAQGAADVAD